MRLTGYSIVLAVITAVSVSTQAQQQSPQAPVVRKLATTLQGSGCLGTAGILTGDPAKGPSIIVEKFGPGCAIPWHWHTPNEHVMMVSGTFNFEIRGQSPVEVTAGDFVFIPSRQISQTTCLGPDPCICFLYTDAPADMHFVDETGTEISEDQALENYVKTHPMEK